MTVDKDQIEVESDKPITIEVPEVEPAPEAAVPEPQEAAKPEAADDAAEELRKQIRDRDERLVAEAEARRRAEDEARRAAQEASAAHTENRGSQLHIIETAIQNATAEVARAKAEASTAAKAGNWDAFTDATMRAARAEAQVPILESGKRELERLIEVSKRAPAPTAQAPADPFEQAIANLAPRAQQFLRGRDHAWITDPEMSRRLTRAHHSALASEHPEGSDAYFSYIDEFMSQNQDGQSPPAQQERPQPQRRAIPAAPPSRSAPSTDGRRSGTTVTLSPQQREAAAIAGISEAEYARNLLKAERAGAFNRPH